MLSNMKAAMKLGDGDVTKLAQQRIRYKKGSKSGGDFMPKGMRKQADKVGSFINATQTIGSNIDALMRGASNNRLKLPDAVKKQADRGLLGIPATAANIAMKRIRGRK